MLNIYLYEIIWDWTQENLYQRISSNLVRSVPYNSIDNPVEEFMLNFVSYSKDMHEPVAFLIQSDLDFPFKETMFPIAEEKLLKHLCS